MSLVHVPSLQLLKGQPFVSILQVYDAAILEAVFFEDVLQDIGCRGACLPVGWESGGSTIAGRRMPLLCFAPCLPGGG